MSLALEGEFKLIQINNSENSNRNLFDLINAHLQLFNAIRLLNAPLIIYLNLKITLQIPDNGPQMKQLQTAASAQYIDPLKSNLVYVSFMQTLEFCLSQK